MERVDHTSLYCIMCDLWYPTEVVSVIGEGETKVYTRNSDPHGIGLPKN